MNSRNVFLTLVGVFAAFAGGFLLANALNKSEIETLREQLAQTKSSADNNESGQSDSELSNEEIQAKLRQADGDPGNFQFQKNLGMALARYASMKQDEKLLVEATRIIDRASSLKADDRDVLIAKGNAHFDISLIKKDNAELETARKAFQDALVIKPDDADVRTDLGLTYFLFDPPEMAKAESDLKKSLSIDPGHEKSLVFLIQALAKQHKQGEARQYLSKLKSAHPENEAISGLSAMIDNPDRQPTQ
jgi:tetratricopeptide (TPR) repeat protein